MQIESTRGSKPKRKPVADALHNFDELPDSATVGLRVVCGLFNCSPTTVWRRCREGAIPKPYCLSSQARK